MPTETETQKQEARELRDWATAKQKWTIGEVANYVEACGSFFFTRDTMKFFGDTRANFGVDRIGARLFIRRKKRGTSEAGKGLRVGELREINFESGSVGVPLSAEEIEELHASQDSVPVLFRVNKRGQFKGTVTAVFPTLPGSPGYLMCYAHIGQHASCSKHWIADTRPAKPEEYAALKRELESEPFRYVLRVVQRISRQMDNERIAADMRI